MSGDLIQTIELGLFLAFAVFVYTAPTVLAAMRRHHNATGIAALNILLGWTALGWIAAFVWACTDPRPTAAR